MGRDQFCSLPNWWKYTICEWVTNNRCKSGKDSRETILNYSQRDFINPGSFTCWHWKDYVFDFTAFHMPECKLLWWGIALWNKGRLCKVVVAFISQWLDFTNSALAYWCKIFIKFIGNHLLILEMVKLLKIKRRDLFQWDSIPILVSLTVKTRKFKLLYFRNKTCFGVGNLNKDLFFINLQPTVNKNS